ncbi:MULTISPECIES: cysteine hydrolase family protein [Pseudomonas syringae group genomosp. 2]|uniref:Isochorismatase family protein n=1 Tax=Pseudomonas amygdali pv. ulmi TaxID=251720 RepID=A0A0Q0D0Z3_PSEA0|nr:MULTISPECIES: isochorismatase family cysteine hydrolase [Pseudomonas syringae group genomosp. 2]EGH06048.1 isochorismatase family protein [Pseudomonas amygdali pv. aesculi str. 0893_23]KPZ11074.1 Isochorismatase family protein [Pseudomonas amygdali pv. ulmi]KWS16131.1 cysteine hydrolase [Pseudomonas amygdali pv. ulmi]KWT11834.1 cysteine hydrolase [Pseudomonas amygdali pv. aesculi]KWT23160.1 cysteine hydrolase [Pseudomonas amygdali pv. aesculi]
MISVNARPDCFTFAPSCAAVVIIDMQRDFLEPGGFGAALGNDVAPLQAIVPSVQQLLALARDQGITVIHTRESHSADLADCPPAKLAHGSPGLRIGDPGPMGRILIRGEPGNQIIDSLTPLACEWVIDKPGKGMFFATDLHQRLTDAGITHLIFAGVTTEVCVQTSMREASDRGYRCLLIEDATESYFPTFKQATLDMITAQNAIVGRAASLADLQQALQTRSTP